MPTMDQVAWANANILIGSARDPYSRGALLPEPTTQEEAADRSLLRLIGAIRTVEVIYTPEELAEQARAQGAADAARERAADVDPALPMGQQVAGGAAPAGPPTLAAGAGAPVVIGDEDLKAEHQAAAKDAAKAADPKADDKADDKAAQHPPGRRASGSR